jgi:signal transduction histidine kinase
LGFVLPKRDDKPLLVIKGMGLNDVKSDGAASVGKAKAAPNLLSGAERERLRAALHDGLGQLLTSISFLATSLRQKLTSKDLPEAADASEILALTGRAISETQALVAEDSQGSGFK